MSQVLLIANPFEPLHNIERFQVQEGVTPREWLSTHFGGDFVEFQRPTVLQWNGELVMREQWGSRKIRHGDVLAFVTLPGEVFSIIAVVIAIVAVAASVAMYLLLPDPKIPSDNTQNAADSVYTLRGQTNRFRPNEPIEVAYGRVRIWPTYACRPYSEYSGNMQYQYSLFCLGQGEYDINAIQFDDTPVSDFSEVELEIVPPGGTVSLVESGVFTALEVNNIELLGPNEDDYNGPSGDFIINDWETPIHRIAVDVSFPQGLYELNDQGKLRSETVRMRFSVLKVGEDGEALPGESWETLLEPSVKRNDNTPQRVTFSKNVSPGRYKIRGQRTSNRDKSTRVASQTRWESAKGYSKHTESFGNVTMIAMKALATNSLNDNTAKSFNVVATRKLPTWTPESGWGTPVATRNPIWSFCDIFRAHYGAILPDEYLDMVKLKAMADDFESREECFDWIFDTSLTVWEAAKMPLAVVHSMPIPQGSLITAVRDVPQTLPSAIFNQHNIIKGTLKKSLAMHDFQPFDGLIVEYTDQATWKPKEVKCVLPGRNGVNLDRIKLPGCTDRDHAYREGMYIQARRELQRKTVTFETGLEGHIPTYMDLIAVTHDTLRMGQGGMILAYDEVTREMTLSEQVNFASDWVTHVIALRGDDGAIMGAPIPVTPGTAANKVILESDPPEELDFSLNRVPPLYAFGVADIWSFMGKVSSIRPIDETRVEIVAVNYHKGVYSWETATTVPAIERPTIRNPINPRVSRVDITPVPEKADRVFVDWPPVPGAASYIVQVCYLEPGDDLEDVEWTNVGTFSTAPVEVGTNVSTMIARVAPFALSGNVIYTNSEPFVVGSNITPPGAPTPSDTQPPFLAETATVRWGAVNKAEGYVADIYTGEAFMRRIEVGTALRADYSFDEYEEDGGVGREIEFHIKSLNLGGESEPAIIKQTNPPPENPPTDLIVGAPTGTDYPASWSYGPPEGDEKEFRIYGARDSGFVPSADNLITTATIPLSATIPAPILPLYWRVGIVDKWGPEVTLSEEARIPMAIPQLVQEDVAFFVNLIESNGGQMGDGIISREGAIDRLTWFVANLYAEHGRVDFWLLMEAYQVGFGSKAYSFHGVEGTLVNGPTWEPDGIAFVRANSQYIQTPTAIRIPFTAFSVVFIPGTDPRYAVVWGNDNSGSVVNMNLYTDNGAPQFAWGGPTPSISSSRPYIGQWAAISLAAGPPNASATIYGNAGEFLASGGTPTAQLDVGRLRIGGRSGDYMHGKIALHLHPEKEFSQSQITNLYGVFKSTVGKDLILS